MFNGILIGIIIAHITAYKEYYISIVGSFVVTYTLKKLIKCLDSDIADSFALGGYAETATCVIVLLLAMKNNGNKSLPELRDIGIPQMPQNNGISWGDENRRQEIVGGWLGNGLGWVRDKFINH